jgi:3-phenylpropionate/cinnamic acid dioxygenase small subunit
MDDHEAIRQLLYRYSFYVDQRDYEKLGALLSDATFSLVWETEGIEHTGIRGADEIRAYYANHQKDRRPSRHVITNAVIDIADDGESAFVYAYLTSVGHPPEPPSVLLSGHYEDRFEKIDGAWRFIEKTCIMDLP